MAELEESRQLIMLPGPTNVPPKVMRAMIKPMINHRGPEFRELYEGILGNAKYVFQTKGDVVVLTSSGTGGVECAVTNVIQGARKIIVPVGGIFGQRLRETIAVMGGEPIEIPVDWKRAVTMDMIENVIKKEKDAKAVAVIYNETSTGSTIKCMREIGEFCNEHDLLFIVDAISILGGDSLPVDDWHVDICIAGSQKCLMSPPGLAILSISDKAWSTIEKAENIFYFNLKSYRKYKEEGQTPFTPAIPLYYALDEALKMIREEGLENVFFRHKVCAKAFYRAVEEMELVPFTEEEFRSNTVIAINNPPKVSDVSLREILRRKYKVVIAGGQGKLKGSIFRIGTMGKISRAEVMQTIGALNMTFRDLGYESKFDGSISAAKEVFEKETI
ncbi:MAG: alanine--glyoxylate aminotransferase family protein [Candidatus Methylarchaceae archaeon HK01M]|nr:alanine--glyoxylate aminotransferase family protein [Candidatus Methylarchaceae archaeon HK01M]